MPPARCSPRSSRFVLLLSGWLAALNGAPAAAHPHVFIDHSVTLVFGASDLVALRFSWTFDEMYSSLLRADYVKSKGALTPDDVRELEKKAFANLSSYDYFLVLRLNGDLIKLRKVTDFTARLDGARMTYTFTVPIEAGAAGGRATLEAIVFDPEYYVAFEFSKARPYLLEHAEAVAAECGVTIDKRPIPVYGMIDTDILICTYGRKS
jgi:ABC-type uncharacterized transport system substrate-binding protein